MTDYQSIVRKLEAWFKDPWEGKDPPADAIRIGPLYEAGANAQWEAIKKKFHSLMAEAQEWEHYGNTEIFGWHILCECKGALYEDERSNLWIEERICASCGAKYRVEFNVWRKKKRNTEHAMANE